jgi:hypothetical protein
LRALFCKSVREGDIEIAYPEETSFRSIAPEDDTCLKDAEIVASIQDYQDAMSFLNFEQAFDLWLEQHL